MPTLYAIFQHSMYAPHLPEWVDYGWAGVSMLPVAQGWNKVGIEADKQNSFCAQSVHSRVGANLGPIVVVGNLKQSAIAALRGRVSDRLVVEVCQFPAMPEDLIDRFRLALEMHESGEPFLPERLVAALLLVRKLEKYHYWVVGAKDKSYLWADDVAKGRGIPATLATIVKEVANQLALKGLLKTNAAKAEQSTPWSQKCERK